MKYIKTFESVEEKTFKDWLKTNPQNYNTDEIVCVNANLIDLNGIEEFEEIETLCCFDNQLTKLPDLSKLIHLNLLDCSDNQLKELPDLSKLKNLQMLDCSYNQLTKLPDLFDILDNFQYLDCSDNKLPYTDLKEYIEWHKKEYPWKWESKKYNL